jgi:glycine cleavage system H protein
MNIVSLLTRLLQGGLGNRVTVQEMKPARLPGATDAALAKRLALILRRRGMTVHFQSKCGGCGMVEVLQFTVDKFTFRFPTDRHYHREGVWALFEEGKSVRIGLSDFVQQHSGDIAFVEVKPVGTVLAFGDEAAVIETMKADLILPTPVSGKVVEVNPAMEAAPEAINQDPYGAGWLGVIEADNWESDRARLLGPAAYMALAKELAEEEAES